MNKLWVMMLAGFFVIGCGGPADDAVPDDPGYEDEAAVEDEEEGVFDPMVGTIDRAEEVEDLNMQRKEDMDAAIEGDSQ